MGLIFEKWNGGPDWLRHGVGTSPFADHAFALLCAFRKAQRSFNPIWSFCCSICVKDMGMRYQAQPISKVLFLVHAYNITVNPAAS